MRGRSACRRRAHAVHPGILATAACAILAAGCGVGVDESPRPLDIEASTTTVAESPSDGQLSTVLYYVRDGKLLPLERELPDRTASTVINALTQSPSPAVAGVGTSLPAGTRVLETVRGGDRLVVDLSQDFDTVVGLARQQAIGQMVMSITRGPTHDVEFRLEGRPLTVSSTSRGDTTVVDQCDFEDLLAVPEGEAVQGLAASSIQELERRHADLDDQCQTR